MIGDCAHLDSHGLINRQYGKNGAKARRASRQCAGERQAHDAAASAPAVERVEPIPGYPLEMVGFTVLREHARHAWSGR